MSQRAIPAVWMRGGTSKGLFFHARDLPTDPAERDALLLRAIGSPDPFGTQIDGLGGATSSTSKVVVVDRSARDDCDVDYRFGHVAIGEPVIDWSGNCGNLTAAVGPFAIDSGLVPATEPISRVAIWQANLGKRIEADVPVADGLARVDGDFTMDGVAFPGAAIDLRFADAGGEADGGVLPTGRPVDVLEVPGLGEIEVTLIHAGNVAVFVRAADLGLTATETPAELAADANRLARLNQLRDHATVALGLADSPEDAARRRPATPKLHLIGPQADHRLHTGRELATADIDLCARALSMGRPHHAYPGTSAVATAVAAALPGSVAHDLATGSPADRRIGHAAGMLRVGAEVVCRDGAWIAPAVNLPRSARCLMAGEVFIPAS
ncbi:MAG: PrpF domain-containing protein [Salinisphaeraceae bacterium]